MLDSAAQSLRELVDYMEPQGLTLALENLPRTCIGNSAREIAYLTGCVPELRLCLDTNHFTSPHPDVRFRPLQRLFPSLRAKWNSEAEGGVSYAQRFAEQIVTVHISDYDGIDECHWLPGQGHCGFQGKFTRRLPGRDLTLRSCLSRTSGAGESGPLAPGSSAVMKNGKAEPN